MSLTPQNLHFGKSSHCQSFVEIKEITSNDKKNCQKRDLIPFLFCLPYVCDSEKNPIDNFQFLRQCCLENELTYLQEEEIVFCIYMSFKFVFLIVFFS